MSIFNSLGSNYDFSFALKTLFSIGSKKDSENLKNFLENKYGGKAELLYKGREAIQLALEIVDQKGSIVAINGFTCLAVSQVVKNAGYKTCYLDIEKNSLNFSADALVKTIEQSPEIKVVIIQNTLSFTCDIENIAAICKEKNLILIEDLAHSIGAKYSNGREAGTVGDFTALSFSQDKMVDGVSGGALVIRNEKFQSAVLPNLITISSWQSFKDKIYPMQAVKVRKTYSIGLGKIIHRISRGLKLFNNPVLSGSQKHVLRNWYTKAINRQFINLDKDLEHRKTVARIYLEKLNSVFLADFKVDVVDSAYLRFPIFVKDRSNLILFLKQNGIYISDIWYDAPVAPKKYENLSDYLKGTCPNSEQVSEMILNLPTHRNVSEESAKKIVSLVNSWGQKNGI